MFFLMIRRPPSSPLFPYATLFRSIYGSAPPAVTAVLAGAVANIGAYGLLRFGAGLLPREVELASPVLIALGGVSIIYGDRKSTRLNSSHANISYAVFCLKKKTHVS